MALNIQVISGDRRVPVTPAQELAAPTVVPAQYLTVEVEGLSLPETVHLDGRQVPLIRNDTQTRGHVVIDAFRSVGFHCLRVGDGDFYFATEDAKLKLQGILELLTFLETEGLGWSGQLFFADGSAVRHAKVDYAWLLKVAPRILALAEEIAARPMRRAQLTKASRVPGSGRLFLKDTIALLRRNSRALLEPDERGVLVVEAQRYSPRVAVTGHLERSFNLIGNRRMTHLLESALDLSRSLRQEPRVPSLVRENVTKLAGQFREKLELFPFAQLRSVPGRLPARPAPEEIADQRYREAFDLHEELSSQLAWEPGLKPADRLAYVAFSDQIYQAFVAVVLARAFDTKQVSPSLQGGLARPLFRSDLYDIYYDTTPPTPEFCNWRDQSSRPTDQRPDLTMINRATRRGLLVDAKYRVDGAGGLPTSALEDAQIYLQSFERKAIALCYPGRERHIQRVEGRGYTILQVPLSPGADLEQYVRDRVRPELEALMEPLGGYD